MIRAVVTGIVIVAPALAQRQTLEAEIGALIDRRSCIMDAPAIDQSTWSYLKQFDNLAGRNPQSTYEEMEWGDAPAAAATGGTERCSLLRAQDLLSARSGHGPKRRVWPKRTLA